MPELDFKGKEFVYNHHLAIPHRPLVPHTDKSIGESRFDGNLSMRVASIAFLSIPRTTPAMRDGATTTT